MRVPADVDQLMWFLAESGDDAALAEFRKRYPDFEIELIRRQSVVRGLKDARPEDKDAPVFRPRDGALELPRTPARWPWVVGGAALAGLAMASYVATSSFIQRQPDQPLRIEGDPKTPVGTDTKPRFETTNPNGPQPNRVRSTDDPRDPAGQPETPPVRENALRAWEMPQTVTLEEAPLHAVLGLIATQCGMQIEIAPNTPNPNVASIRFDGITGAQMIKELGRSFGFTALEQEPGKFLVIPTTDFTDVN